MMEVAREDARTAGALSGQKAAITIDNGVPLPPKQTRKSKEGVMLAIRALEVGQSFVMPPDGRPLRKTQNLASACARYCHGKFATRQVEENGQKVVRVWRVA